MKMRIKRVRAAGSGIMPADLIGCVIDEKTMSGIAGAAVSIKELRRNTIHTINGGFFFFQGIRRSYVTLRVSSAGYLAKDQRVNTSSSIYTEIYLTKA